MFAIGLDLRPGDFVRILRFPRAALVGLVGQLVFLPLLGFALAMAVRDDISLALGIVLLAACPGGATSNIVSFIARANTALSVSFTAVTSTLSFVTVPLIVNLGLGLFDAGGETIALSVVETSKRIFVLTLLPIGIGMALKGFLPDRVARIQPYLQPLSTALLATILIVIFVINWQLLIEQFWRFAPVAVALTTIAGVAGYAAARVAGLDRADRFTISIEVGFQNISLAQLIAATILGRPELGLLAAIYPFANWVPLLPWLLHFRRQSDRLAAAERQPA